MREWVRRSCCGLVWLGMGVALLGCQGPRLWTPPDEDALAPRQVRWARSVQLERRTVYTDGASVLLDLDSSPSMFVRTGLSAAGRNALAATGTKPAARADSLDQSLLILPIEFEADNGAANGNANLLRLLPAYEWPRRPGWRIQHLDIITLADAPGGLTGGAGNPEPVSGPRATGLSDFTHLSFYSPVHSGSIIWGAGAALGIPTATDDVLGSGKWSAGPALRVTYRSGPWNLGLVGAQRWSFAGDSSRAEVDQLMARGAFRRQLGEHWYLVSAPLITANWNAASDERWLVPLGGGLGRKFDLWGRPWSASIQGYANVIRPTGAPTWSIRLTLTAFIPLGP